MKNFVLIIIALAFIQWWFTDPTVKVQQGELEVGYVVKNTSGASSSDTLPMLVALHGNGDTPSNFFGTALDEISVPARIILLKAPLPYGTGYAWPSRKDKYAYYAQAVIEAIQIIQKKYPSKGHPHVLGFSGGAMMAYYLGATQGDDFSSVVAISGYLPEEFIPKYQHHNVVPIIAFHGEQDDVISIGSGQRTVEWLKHYGHTTMEAFDGGHGGIFNVKKQDISQKVDELLLIN